MVTDLGALSVRVDYRTSMTIAPTSTVTTAAATAAVPLGPHSDPIALGGRGAQFRPRSDSASVKMSGDDSEADVQQQGGGANDTSNESQDRIFSVDNVNTPQHLSG